MNKSYIDCHCHILYGIDDGAKTIEDSIALLKLMETMGFKEIILTPHYRGEYLANNKEKLKRLEILNKEIEKNNINIKLYLANEVHITSNLLDLIKKDEIKLFNNYIFLELPFTTKIYNLNKIIYELQTNNINVILVHPERYQYFKISDIEDLVDKDVLLQVNYESIIGKYGMRAKKLAKELLKRHLVTFLATDVHRTTTMMFLKFGVIEKKIKKLVGDKEYKDLTYNNIKKIIDNS